jgi:hypothetical protein
MSQNVSTNQKEREPLLASTSIQPWSAEAEANKLMDDLFSDIDHILESGNRLPTEPVKPEYVALKSIAIPQIIAPPAVVPSQELAEQENPDESQKIESKSNESEALETKAAPSDHSRTTKLGGSFEKIILLLGLVVFGVSSILVLMNQKKLTWPWLLKPKASPTATTSSISAADAQFANYMLRSLDVIDSKAKARALAATSPNGTNLANANSIPAPSNRTLAPNQPQRVLERVYIPVYPPQTPVTPSGFPTGIRPTVPSVKPPASSPANKPSTPSPSSKRSTPAPSSVAKRTTPNSSPVAKRTTPNSSSAAKPKTQPSPQTPAPIAVSPLPVLPPAAVVPIAPTTQAAVPSSKFTFVGFSQLGDRPAALFQVSGLIQSVHVGEAIGDSGWTLVSVGEQEAVIRRNGEVRSIYAGQSF